MAKSINYASVNSDYVGSGTVSPMSVRPEATGPASFVNSYWSYTDSRPFKMIDNYVYVYHTGILIAIPTWPEMFSDSMNTQYNQTPVMSRSAPIFSYSNSGPRTIQIDLHLHRGFMSSVDYLSSKLPIRPGINSIGKLDDDYIDVLMREIQACALPKYADAEKMVDPPMIAVRFGNEIFCKGVVNGTVGITYSGPILETDKYAKVDVSFTVTEIDPYDAETIIEVGSFRGLNTSLERNIWRRADGTGGIISSVR